jgi:hypothetical protein
MLSLRCCAAACLTAAVASGFVPPAPLLRPWALASTGREYSDLAASFDPLPVYSSAKDLASSFDPLPVYTSTYSAGAEYTSTYSARRLAENSAGLEGDALVIPVAIGIVGLVFLVFLLGEGQPVKVVPAPGAAPLPSLADYCARRCPPRTGAFADRPDAAARDANFGAPEWPVDVVVWPVATSGDFSKVALFTWKTFSLEKGLTPANPVLELARTFWRLPGALEDRKKYVT